MLPSPIKPRDSPKAMNKKEKLRRIRDEEITSLSDFSVDFPVSEALESEFIA